MKPTRKTPLFIISGASCAGKSAMCEVPFRNETDYIVLESDLLWNSAFDTPEDGYKAFRQTWMRVAKNISQIGLPVVLCGCAIPEQLESLDERCDFAGIHYLAVVCDDDVLKERLVARQVTDSEWIRSSLEFNAWLKEHARETDPPMCLLDNTRLSPSDAAEIADKWIREQLRASG